MTVPYETQLWQRLSKHSLVTGEEPTPTEDNAPWYVRTMLGIAGWIGALFMLGAVFSAFSIMFDSTLTAAVLGLIACILAIVIYRLQENNDFMAQFGFAVSLAGQGLMVFSMLQGLEIFEVGDEAFLDRIKLLALMLLVLQAILFLMIPNFLHRLWSCVLGIGALIFLMIQFGFYPLTASLLLAVTAVTWLQEFNWASHGSKIQALAYSLVFVCFAHLVLDSHVLGPRQFWHETFGVAPLGGEFGETVALALSGVVLVAVVFVLLKRSGLSGADGKGLAALLLAILVAFIGIRTPGITIGLVFVLIGYAHGNRVLAGIGLVTLLVFLSQFYYQLNLTLLQKSLVLFFSGISLLVVRQLLHYFWPKRESGIA